MELTDFYNHNSFMQEVKEGYKLINNIPRGKQEQEFQIGDTVTTTDKSPVRHDKIEVIDVYEDNGYFYYVCKWKLTPKARKVYTDTFRQIDIKSYEILINF